MFAIDSWEQEWLFQRCHRIMQQYYGVNEWIDRGDTWLSCHQCYMHDICVLMEANHA